MAYSTVNFTSKKALKEAVARGDKIGVWSPGPFGCNQNGTEYLEGPHAPMPHKWYAQVEVLNGVIVKVK